MKEIRWHGRGGQGAVVFVKEGKSAIALPKFGAERRGTGKNKQARTCRC